MGIAEGRWVDELCHIVSFIVKTSYSILSLATQEGVQWISVIVGDA